MAAATTIYPDAGLRPATRAIYATSLDSRTRERILPSGSADPSGGGPSTGGVYGPSPVLDSTPSEYEVRFERPVDRVGTIQLGDFSIGGGAADPRWVFETARQHLMLSEPIHLRQTTTVSLGSVARRTTMSSQYGEIGVGADDVKACEIFFPPTLNPVVDAIDDAAGGTSVSTLENHNLDSVWAYWPAAVASQTALRATRFYDADPLVSPGFGAVLQDDDTFTIPTSYLANTLTTHAASPAAAIYDDPDGGFLHVPRLTVPELVDAVNGAFATMFLSGETHAQIDVRLNSLTSEVEVRQLNSTRLVARPTARGTGAVRDTLVVREDIFASITVTPYDALWWLGLDSIDYPMERFANSRRGEDGLPEDPAPYVYRFVPRAVRTVALPLGTPASAATVTRDLTERLSAVFLGPDLSAGQRTLNYENAVGAAVSVVIPAGYWRPELLANYLSAQMTPIACTFAPRTAKFTFAHALGAEWSLVFSGADAGPLARRLGFAEGSVLRGLTAYTSESPAAGGVFDETAVEDTGENPVRQFPITVSVDAATNQLRFSTTEITSGPFFLTNLSTTPLAFTDSGATTELATGLREGDVLKLTHRGTNEAFSVIVDGLAGSAVAPNEVLLDLGAVQLGGVDLPNAAAVRARVIGRSAFVLHANRLPKRTAVPATNPFGAFGVGPRYGSAFEPLGLPARVLRSSEAGALVSPFSLALAPPEYVLVELVTPRGQSTKHMHRSTDFDGTDPRPEVGRSILAKLLLTNGFARVSEEMTHVNFTTATKVEKIHIRFLNPDLSLCDWHGREHNFTLLLRSWEGSAGSPLLG